MLTVLAQNGEVTTREQFVATAVVLGVSAVVYWAVIWLGRRYVTRMEDRGYEQGARAQTLWSVLRRVVLIVVLAMAILFALDSWEVSITPFLAVGTAVAAAVGFGAQNVVKDFLSGFFILLEDQFHVGDTVTIADTTGTVEDIQLRVTKLRDLEGNAHYVPNGQIVVTSNYTSQFAQPVIDVGVAYETDIDAALEIFADELTKFADDPEYAGRIIGPAELLGVNELGDSSVVLRGRLTTAADERWAIRREALRRVKNRFDAEGISIPFPQVTINRKRS
jgi:small conductance mechanosensitive channel